jgi:hypothetical protein
MITIAEERAHAAGLPTRWKWHGPLVAATFFVLTCLAVLAFFGFWKVLHVPGEVLTSIVCIAAAETLIRKHNFFGTGVEAALWICGLIALIFALPGQSKPEAIFLFAAAFAIAGWRLRQPYFGAAAVLLCIAYFGIRNANDVVFIAAVAVIIVSLLGLSREQKRPSVQRLFETLLIAAPIMPAIWKGAVGPAMFTSIYLLLAIALFSTALVIRQHAPAISGAVCGVIAFIALQDVIDARLDFQLMAAGAVLLIASAMISRGLRNNTSGLVTSPSSITPFDEELQLAATVALAPKTDASAPHEPGRGEGGGEFGGAGATGKF